MICHAFLHGIRDNLAVMASTAPPTIPDRLATPADESRRGQGVHDLHLIAGYPPVLRLHGELTELREPPLDLDESDAAARHAVSRQIFSIG